MAKAYLVWNSPFNREWYPKLIGKIFRKPPGYAQVQVVKNVASKHIEKNPFLEYAVMGAGFASGAALTNLVANELKLDTEDNPKGSLYRLSWTTPRHKKAVQIFESKPEATRVKRMYQRLGRKISMKMLARPIRVVKPPERKGRNPDGPNPIPLLPEQVVVMTIPKEKGMIKKNPTLTFRDKSPKQREHIFHAVDELGSAGVSFDTGGTVGGKQLDWELDWSLKGAALEDRSGKKTKIISKNLKGGDMKNPKRRKFTRKQKKVGAIGLLALAGAGFAIWYFFFKKQSVSAQLIVPDYLKDKV